ncbi:hypothetical protein [Serratia quinivorans]|uniref:hypothetical protein n=1 Tax=Serratia quinivorans TaxID=137545 RepID=UPI0021788A84|nr:hypothetical protein [Serratia quinivorans]CAI1110366.1 Uncharacterised protein [Serratia quinivorans]
MTQTLTTEAMQEIYEAAVHEEATGGDQDAGFELLCKLEDVGGTGATIRKLIDMVRAANRAAQPVAVPEYLTYLREPIISNVLADDDNSPMANAARILAREVNFWRSQPLFTAPPAPAVSDFKALAENLVENLVDCGGADEKAVEQYLAFAEKTCRAAMLAQPVRRGCKLLEPTANMQAAGAAAIRFDTTAINKLFTANAVYRAMIEAAPGDH